MDRNLKTNFGKRRATRFVSGSLATTDRSVDWARSFSSLMPRINHNGRRPAGLQTRIAGSAARFSAALTRRPGKRFSSSWAGSSGSSGGPETFRSEGRLSFSHWVKVESRRNKQSQADLTASLVETSQLRQSRRSGCAPAEPYPPQLRLRFTRTVIKKNEKMKKR